MREPQPFERERDLAGVIALAGRLRAARGSGYLHPGGLQWWLRNLVKGEMRAWVWYDDGALIAFSVVDREYVTPHADPTRLDVLELVAWHEAQQPVVEISVWDDDRRLLAAVTKRGYATSGHFGPQLIWRMGGEPARPALPDGYRFVPFTPEMDDAYIAMHRDAWSTNKPSEYRRALHDAVTAMPQFDRTMVPIVAAPDGTLAAYCIGWFDPASRWTEIEPLGTRPAFTRRGLAHAVVHEVIHRSWQRGAEAVMVWVTDPASTTHVNEPARRLYVTSGMKPDRVLREYRRAG